MELNADMHAATMEPGSDLEAFRKMLEALQLSRGVSTAESEEPAQKPTKGKLTIQEVELAIKNAYTTKDNIILAVAELSRLLGLTASDLISAHTSGPSFVASEWHTSYNLPADPHQIEVVPPHESYMLPIDFQTRVYEQMWVSIGVFSSKHIEQHNEATAARMIEPYITALLKLFGGFILNTPEVRIEGTTMTTEAKLGTLQGIFFLLKGCNVMIAENLPQLMAEMESAANTNLKRGLGGLPIYGMLANMQLFNLYRYTSWDQKFVLQERLGCNCASREAFLEDMIYVVNAIFTRLLDSYVLSLDIQNELHPWHDGESVAFSDRSKKLGIPLLPTSKLKLALDKAKAAQKTFQRNWQTVRDADGNGLEGLKCLQESVSFLKPIIQPLEFSDEQINDYVKASYENYYRYHC